MKPEIEASDARRVFELLGSIFFNGGFRAETPNEMKLESLLRKYGYFFETEEQLLARIGRDHPDAITDTDPPIHRSPKPKRKFCGRVFAKYWPPSSIGGRRALQTSQAMWRYGERRRR